MGGNERQALVLASNNQGKLTEFRSLLAGVGWDLASLAQAGVELDVEETGSTFRENALLKAVAVARRTGSPALADDSGLEVDAMNGEPGVYSARFGGPGLDDDGRYRLLLGRLEGLPWPRRTARFRAVVAVAWADGRVLWRDGTLEGIIARAPRGSYGFGYDPVLYLPDWGYTVAELPPAIKNAISHRARAVQALKSALHASAP